MVIAFDYDGVATSWAIQNLIRKCKSERIEVWIVTARKENDYNKNIMKVILEKIKVGFCNVIFCDEKPKAEFIQGINADIYIDDISDEFIEITNHTNTIPLLWHNRS